MSLGRSRRRVLDIRGPPNSERIQIAPQHHRRGPAGQAPSPRLREPLLFEDAEDLGVPLAVPDQRGVPMPPLIRHTELAEHPRRRAIAWVCRSRRSGGARAPQTPAPAAVARSPCPRHAPRPSGARCMQSRPDAADGYERATPPCRRVHRRTEQCRRISSDRRATRPRRRLARTRASAPRCSAPRLIPAGLLKAGPGVHRLPVAQLELTQSHPILVHALILAHLGYNGGRTLTVRHHREATPREPAYGCSGT